MMNEIIMEIAESAEDMVRKGQKILHNISKLKGSGMNQRGAYPRGGGYRGMNYRDNYGNGNYEGGSGSGINQRGDMFGMDMDYDPRFM